MVIIYLNQKLILKRTMRHDNRTEYSNVIMKHTMRRTGKNIRKQIHYAKINGYRDEKQVMM